MKSITIHGLEEPLNTLIRDKAKIQSLSLNKTIKKLLEDALNITQKQTDYREDFIEFLGCWNQQQVNEFNQIIEECTQIDTEDWH
ncbi:MAG: hypothetical protein KAU26_05400 [Methylococcales bacterium]|nr:hypothetical protein [Methylococcales bacterium]